MEPDQFGRILISIGWHFEKLVVVGVLVTRRHCCPELPLNEVASTSYAETNYTSFPTNLACRAITHGS